MATTEKSLDVIVSPAGKERHNSNSLAKKSSKASIHTGKTQMKEPSSAINQAHVTSLRLLIAPWIIHFKSLNYIKEGTMDMLDRRICRKTVDLTTREPSIRRVLILFIYNFVNISLGL